MNGGRWERWREGCALRELGVQRVLYPETGGGFQKQGQIERGEVGEVFFAQRVLLPETGRGFQK